MSERPQAFADPKSYKSSLSGSAEPPVPASAEMWSDIVGGAIFDLHQIRPVTRLILYLPRSWLPCAEHYAHSQAQIVDMSHHHGLLSLLGRLLVHQADDK